jgi:peptide/nickel transport system substrate-binding protein
MLKGELDVLSNELPEDKVTELKKSGKVNVVISPGLNFNYVLLNLRDKTLKDPRVRQALFASLNREEIIQHKLDSLAYPASSILAPSNPFSAPKLLMPLLTKERAKILAKELKLTGTRLSLKVSPQALTNGRLVAQQMEELGTKVDVQSFEWGKFYDDVKSGRFQMALMRWVAIVDPDIYRMSLSTAEFVPGRNRGFYSNKAFDQIVEQGRWEMDFDKRRSLYLKAQQIIIDDMPIIPLWYNANINVLSHRVRNFEPMIAGSFHSLLKVTKE